MLRRFISLACLCAVGALPLPAMAGARRVYIESRGTVLDGAALNGASAALTTTAFRVEEFSTVTLAWAATDADDSVTAVTMICWGSSIGDSGTSTWYQIPVITATAAGGTLTYAPYLASMAITTNENAAFTIGVLGHRYVKCEFDATGAPTGADLITVNAIVTVP